MMKPPSSLESLRLRTRSQRWADLRGLPREMAGSRSAGLKIHGRIHIVGLYDWSASGACIDLPGPASIGERVGLVWGKERSTGRIAWITDGRAGVEFDD